MSVQTAPIQWWAASTCATDHSCNIPDTEIWGTTSWKNFLVNEPIVQTLDLNWTWDLRTWGVHFWADESWCKLKDAESLTCWNSDNSGGLSGLVSWALGWCAPCCCAMVTCGAQGWGRWGCEVIAAGTVAMQKKETFGSFGSFMQLHAASAHSDP